MVKEVQVMNLCGQVNENGLWTTCGKKEIRINNDQVKVDTY